MGIVHRYNKLMKIGSYSMENKHLPSYNMPISQYFKIKSQTPGWYVEYKDFFYRNNKIVNLLGYSFDRGSGIYESTRFNTKEEAKKAAHEYAINVWIEAKKEFK